jgi:phage gp29-like protein
VCVITTEAEEPSPMIDHSKCTHPRTKTARTACRKAQEELDAAVARHPASSSPTKRSSDAKQKVPQSRRRLPSMVSPLIRPVIEAAKARGLRILVASDPEHGVNQAFMIVNPQRPNCELLAGIFKASLQGDATRAEYYHIEEGEMKQLSRRRALLDVNALSSI